MSEYNIQMNKYNALNAGYDQLFPATKIKNVDGLNEALQNNDPRRWGLGKDGIPIVNKATLDGLFTPGWYMFYDENNVLDNGVRVALVEVKGRNTSITSTCVQEIWTQDITHGGGLSYKAERLWDGSKWQPFEWFTPPMLNGIEYRTTERYNGKPVYAKVVNVSVLPSAGSYVSPSHGIANFGYCVECCGSLVNGTSIPYVHTNKDGQILLGVNSNNIRIYSDIDLSALTAVVKIKYTKTTD